MAQHRLQQHSALIPKGLATRPTRIRARVKQGSSPLAQGTGSALFIQVTAGGTDLIVANLQTLTQHSLFQGAYTPPGSIQHGQDSCNLTVPHCCTFGSKEHPHSNKTSQAKSMQKTNSPTARLPLVPGHAVSIMPPFAQHKLLLGRSTEELTHHCTNLQPLRCSGSDLQPPP